MSQEQFNNAPNHLKSAYIAINIILIAPVILWPLPTLFFDNPMLTDAIIPKWHLSIIILLIAATVMDSMLYSINNTRQVIYTTLWIFVVSILSLKYQDNTWLLALLFLAHSFRTAYDIMLDKQDYWWLKLSWARDIIASLWLLFWLTLNII